jgi:hypothetical protein
MQYSPLLPATLVRSMQITKHFLSDLRRIVELNVE